MRKGRICGPTPEDFEKMREVGLRMKASPFNSMLSLREMEENNVAPDSLMVNEVLKIYAAESKVESMARFMRMWSGEEGIKLERETMAAMANAYAKAGSTKKAIEMYGGVAAGPSHNFEWPKAKKTFCGLLYKYQQ
ncbi:putative pentatricopeptide repeat-containing protein At1g28020 [Brassica rapa]|uniref:putative pentatricopeptide repeat-containing protein At1g28020 n=1 Tax=Brassica campestris TaxID=3711 RepID=UPI00142E3511|nr:putative pentatricopeptide repeat-containing protein At1g28020 [Brassica rapa]